MLIIVFPDSRHSVDFLKIKEVLGLTLHIRHSYRNIGSMDGNEKIKREQNET